MKVSEIKDILSANSLSPNKKFGQNFLVSGDAAAKIAGLAADCARGSILEIGPGLGAVTERLVELGHPVTAVEIDSGIFSYLEKRFCGNKRLTLAHADFLKFIPDTKYDIAVSNLPYYCASEILFRLAENFSPRFILAMMQSEMASRLASKPGTKEYGAFTVSLGLYYKSEIIFEAGGGDFYPAPEVRSSFVRLSRIDDRGLDLKQRRVFHSLVRSVFWGRRKTMLKALTDSPHSIFGRAEAEHLLERAKISPSVRGEQLTIENFMELAVLWEE